MRRSNGHAEQQSSQERHPHIDRITTACAAPGPQPAGRAAGSRQCFNASSVNSFNAISDNAVIVTVGVNRYYQLDIVGTCPDIDWLLRVALRSTSGSSFVCEGLDAEFLVPSPSGLQRCPVVGVHPISPEAAKAAMARHP
ncbi:MAG TPA: DUF6491 family protein [Sphingomicrobium sp.]|nr:DUF6491 family protein [Sphingomicrobium sp.]